MTDYISREEAYKALEETDSKYNIPMAAFNYFSEKLRSIPAADHGRLIIENDEIKGVTTNSTT